VVLWAETSCFRCCLTPHALLGYGMTPLVSGGAQPLMCVQDLATLCPSYVVLYDPDLAFLRQVGCTSVMGE
jgi:hypothetical protein